MLCEHCKTIMKKVMRFERNKSYKLYKCPKCYSETKPKRIFFSDEEISRNNTNTNKLHKKKNQNKNIKKRGKTRNDYKR